jgi:hypothetical protein
MSRTNQQHFVGIYAECSRDFRVVFALRVKFVNHVGGSKNKITYAAVCHDASLLGSAAKILRHPGTVSTAVGLRRTRCGPGQQVYSVEQVTGLRVAVASFTKKMLRFGPTSA